MNNTFRTYTADEAFDSIAGDTYRIKATMSLYESHIRNYEAAISGHKKELARLTALLSLCDPVAMADFADQPAKSQN